MTRDLPFDPDAVSRDPSDYRQTQHFRQQVRYRQLPSPSTALACAAIEDGELRRAAQDHQVLFEYRTGGFTWHIIAELIPDDDRKNPLITIYAVNAHGDGKHGMVGVDK